MLFTLHIADADDVDTALALREWLAREDDVDVQPPSAGPPGQLGDPVAVIGLVVGAAFSVAELVMSIAAFRRSRPAAPTVAVTRTDPDGATVRIESSDPEALAAAVRALES